MRFSPDLFLLAPAIALTSLGLLSGCVPKPSNELEEMGEDVLKSKRDEGLQIEIRPIPKDSDKPKLSSKRICSNHHPQEPVNNPPGIEIIKVPFNKERNV